LEQATPSLGWGKRLFPLILIQIYMSLGVLLFAYGPWEWSLRNPDRLYLFLVAVQVALALGYLSVAHKAPADVSLQTPHRTVNWALLTTLAMLPFFAFARTGEWIPNLREAITNPGAAYSESLDLMKKNVHPVFLLRIFVAPLLAALFPLTVFYWRRLQPLARAGAVFCLASGVLLSIATGQRRDIADMLMTLPFFVLAAHWSGISPLRKWTKCAWVAGFGLAVLAFAAYFTISNTSRIGQQTAIFSPNPITLQLPNPNHPLIAPLPPDARPGVMAVTNYATTGYYGLSLALDREFVPMYGVGNSMFLSYVASRFLNRPEIEMISYPVRISQLDGFRYPTFWCTSYPYFASDLSFPGVILLMFVFGRLFGAVWIDALGGKSVCAVILLWMVLILVIYLPSTNRMLQDGDGITSFYFWLAAWIASQRWQPKPALSPARVMA
jgi:hypothetical protein